ncbi:MAG: hypothetical protein AB7I38_02515 [Dehalococcoidia bacterium]
MLQHGRHHLPRLLLGSLALGLAVAVLPFVVTRGRPCATPLPPASGAPVYLTLSGDPRVEELRCEATGRVAFDRVRNAADVDRLLSQEAVVGVIVDPDVYARLRPGQLRSWLAVDSGRAIVGFDLTGLQLSEDTGGPPPPDPALPSSYLGESFYGHRSFRSVPRSGVCGGGGTTPYRGPDRAALLIERLLTWAAPGGGCGFG